MTLELVPLCTAVVTLAPPIIIPGTPNGTRLIGEVIGFDVQGDRITAHLKGAAAADWLLASPDGTLGTVDVRATWETEDGAVIYVRYGGRLDMSVFPGVVYVAPLFDTGDERYQWLTRIQAAAKGRFSDDMLTLTYDMYELR
ncbi:MAG: DUF3237 domain-containing protein [Actinobacteria bacterium]|nr:DUF3237 domain-containing protein [Actinomycetota bacterium]MBV8959333.1 DUF3237 domain-containing protein [Actinomycetota bacterium]MBV9253451.1 DUF3237 domain-containing protein [Actinomycetota bacterium]MBV9935118.1 DUF3237 domain-containing protein [Actinomycetota bacterium]